MVTIYSDVKIPEIMVNNEMLTSKIIANKIEIPIDEIIFISSNAFKNKIYSIGKYYVVQSIKNIEILIPHKTYKNETALIEDVRRKYESKRKLDQMDLKIKGNIKMVNIPDTKN